LLFYCTEYVGPRVGQDLHVEFEIPINVEYTCGQKSNIMLILKGCYCFVPKKSICDTVLNVIIEMRRETN